MLLTCFLIFWNLFANILILFEIENFFLLFYQHYVLKTQKLSENKEKRGCHIDSSLNLQIALLGNNFLQIRLEVFAFVVVFQPADGFFLDLSNTFAGQVKLRPDFFQRVFVIVSNAEIHEQHLFFLLAQ